MHPSVVPASIPRGFSLLEVLAAFVILALVATALFRLFGGALGNVGIAEDASRAVLVAESRLAAARGEPFRAGTESGTEDDGRIGWAFRPRHRGLITGDRAQGRPGARQRKSAPVATRGRERGQPRTVDAEQREQFRRPGQLP